MRRYEQQKSEENFFLFWSIGWKKRWMLKKYGMYVIFGKKCNSRYEEREIEFYHNEETLINVEGNLHSCNQ